jgi:hypothetical protein
MYASRTSLASDRVKRGGSYAAPVALAIVLVIAARGPSATANERDPQP